MELTVKAHDKNLEAVTAFVHSQITDKYSDDTEHKIDLAVEEIFVNIAHYAYGAENTDNESKILCTYEKGLLSVTFIDSGKPFNPLNNPDPDITLSAEERKIGGLGIYLTKKFMDETFYEYTDGKNILTIKKKIV